MKKIILALTLMSIISCGKDKGPATFPTVPGGLSAPNGEVTTTQNGQATLEFGLSGASVVITGQPQHGRLSVNGNSATYRATDPLFTGTDSVKYRLVNGSSSSNEAVINIRITPLPSGTETYTENFPAGAFGLNGWRSYTSTAGHTANSVVSIGAGGRRYRIAGDPGSYAGNAAYNSLFGTLPVDGSGFAMQDWPWKADLIRFAACGVDATMTIKINPINNEYPMAALLLNYDIDGHDLTGYQVLVNAGGGSMTLSRFNKANELATAYIDRWPNTSYGTEANANPVTSGPYKGWNYKNGPWAAGGNVGVGGPKFIAVRYQYDSTLKQTKISYEARGAGGVDASPNSWDQVVTLSGVDSLTPGGSFGMMALNYHTQSMLLTTDFEVSEFKLQCTMP